MKKITYIILTVCLLTGCTKGNFDWAGMWNGQSPYTNVRFDHSMEYNQTHPFKTIPVSQNNYRIYVCTDTHIDSTNRNLTKFVNLYHHDPNCPIAIHLGDMVNADGNYPKMIEAWYADDRTDKSKWDTLFPVVGNHDIYYGQWTEYRKYFGTATYWFDTQGPSGEKLDLFIVFDSSNGTLQTKQMKWLKNVLQTKSKEGYRHIIAVTHTNLFFPYSAHGSGANAGFALEETYEIADLLAKNKIEMYWCGHEHARELYKFNGIEFITVSTLQDPVSPAYYMVVEMGENISYHFEKI